MAIAIRANTGPTASVGTTLTLTKPAGTVAGDEMIATIKCDIDGAITAPGTWVLIAQQADVGFGTTSVYWADGAEANLTFTMPVGTPTNGALGTVFTYTGCDSVTPIGASATSSAVGGASPFTWSAPSVTSTRDNSWRIVGFGYVDITNAAGPTFTESITQRVSGTVSDIVTPARVGISVGDANISPAGASGSSSCTATGGSPVGGTQQAVAFVLQPALPTPSDEGGGFYFLPARQGISIRMG